ncbi:U-box domain-containing protein 25-like [Salvia miltiorrhiza]|uniref:U-box domain-containing protein 25-like n=1 Tax=Salvia miltiorrhiza TaxID=226208 RepID=UPI0025AC7917|nr:U-box domain-containing protein 25-like [Salvia miltiorrhiza]
MKCEEISIPPYFRCPISLDLFKDPVTLWTGQTYDRSCIEKWLAAGNSTCPVTMQKLHDSSLVPNHTLRHLIHDWLSLHSNGYSSLDHKQTSIARIKQIIESDELALATKLLALEELQSLSQDLPHKNSCLITLGFFQMLLHQILGNAECNVMLVEKALSCALNLMPFSELGCLNIALKQDSKYAVFLSLLENGTVFVKKGLCLIIEAVSWEPQTKALCEELGKSDRIVRAIVDIVESEAVEAAIRALSALSSVESNREKIASHGAVEALVACLSSAQKRSTAAAAMSAMEKLASERSAKEALVNHPWGVRAVVKMVFRVCEHEGSESAVNSLLKVCGECERAREKAIGEGVLTQLLLLLQSQSGARTKAKATQLLHLLRST